MKKLAAAAALAAICAMGQEPLIEGKRDSAVSVVIYEDLQCSDCLAFRKMLDEKLLPKYAAAVRFEHRDFPLPKHAWARDAAIVSRYFQQTSPELALEWRKAALTAYKTVTAEGFPNFVRSFARSKGADPAAAAASVSDQKLAAAVERDFQDGVARGIARTPTVLVMGDAFIETFTADELMKSIDAHLETAGRK